MASLLDILGLGAVAQTRQSTARMEGEGIRKASEERDLLARLAQERQAAQDARQARMDALNTRNIESQITARTDPEMGGAPTYGTGLHEVVGPDGKRMYVQASSAGGVRPIDGFAPPPETVPRGPQGSPVQMVGPDGKPIFFNPTTRETITPPAGVMPAGSDRTTAATTVKIAEGKAQLDAIRTARAELARYPQAVGIKRGAGLIPGMGKLGDVVNQNVDPAGVPARQALANVASLKIRDRSGAAVTVSEFPRLAPFIPNEYDTPEKVNANLDALERELSIVLEALAGGASLEEVGASPRGAGVPRGTEQAPTGRADITPFLPPKRVP